MIQIVLIAKLPLVIYREAFDYINLCDVSATVMTKLIRTTEMYYTIVIT